MKNYDLVTDATAAEVERLTGRPAHDTPLGALVERRDHVVEAIRIGIQLDALNNVLHPRCECRGVIMHAPWCKSWNVVT